MTVPAELSDNVKRFIRENAHMGAQRIALQASRYPDLPIAFIAQQVKGRAQVEKKLPTWHANEDIVFPSSLSLEQCTSEQVARFKSLLADGGSGIDITGGFGVDSFFLAQRLDRMTYVERNAELAAIAEANFKTFGAGDVVSSFSGDGLAYLTNSHETHDLVYVDPARRDSRGLKVSALGACEPDIVANWEMLLAKGKQVLVKTSPGLDIEQALRELSHVAAVYVIATGSECRELLFQAHCDYEEETVIHCVDLDDDGPDATFSFLLSDEKQREVNCIDVGKYLYEPNAALMKAGPFKLIAARMNCPAVHPRSRFFSSNSLRREFPGRVFEILDAMPLSRKAAKRSFPEGKANVISRNCGLTADELRRKLKLADGGEIYAIGTRLANETRRVFRCRRLK